MVKTIEITDETGYQKFLKQLPLYRSALYLFTQFRIKSRVHAERVEEIARALNMKKRRERVSFVYDRACDYIDRYNEENGIICAYVNGMCEDPKHQRLPNGCCFICHMQTSTGCPTRNISCKLFYCDHMAEKHKDKILTVKDIDILRLFTPEQRLIVKENVFVTRKTHIRLLSMGSYPLYCIYSVIKPFRFRNI